MPTHCEKAKRHLELAALFLCLGSSNEARASLEAAVALDSNVLSAKDWGLLGDLQQSQVLKRCKEKGLADQKEIFSRASWNQPLASYLQAIKKSRADIDMSLALSLLELICYDDPEQETGWSYAELSHDNAKTILSIPSLCGTLKPEHLYALCSKLHPLVPLALPTRSLAPGLDEPQTLDAKLASEDYLDRLLQWADNKQETDSADTDLVDRLLLLIEIFDARYAYCPYFRDTLTRLFQRLNLPVFDSDEGVISPLLKAAHICAGSSVFLQRHCAEKLWQLGSRRAISCLKPLRRRGAPSYFLDSRYILGMVKRLIVDLFQNNRPLPSDIIQGILKSPKLCSELPRDTINACCTRLDTSGQTPLMQAVRLGDRPVIQFLLTQRISIEQANNQGETAFSLVLKNYQFKVAWLLLSNSQLYWHRLLFSLSAFLAVLVAGVGLLLFFHYMLATSAFACFAIAGLGFLFACYQFLCTPESTHASAKSSPSLGLSDDSRRDFLSATSLSTHLAQPPQKFVVAEAVDQKSTFVYSSDAATSSFCL